MGIIAMMAAVLGFWIFVSHRAALILVAFLAFGLLAFWLNPNPGRCGEKAWFCPLVVDKDSPEVHKPCPPEQPIPAETRIFQNGSANAEVRRQIQSGVCQQTAINRVAKGWKAPFDPAYEAGLDKAE